MTDIDELIAEGSDYATRRFGTVPGHLVHRLTDALRTMTVSRGNVLLLNTRITNALNTAEDERDRYRAAIDEEMTRHSEKRGETARYESGDFDHELPPTHWESYVICNACGTDYPCRTRQTLTRALKENT